jgi:hypothetical protein
MRGKKRRKTHRGVRVHLAGALTRPWLAQRLGGGMGSEGACVSGLERSPAPTAPRCRRQGWGWARLRSEGAMREPEGCAAACGAKNGRKYLGTLAARHENSDGGSAGGGRVGVAWIQLTLHPPREGGSKIWVIGDLVNIRSPVGTPRGMGPVGPGRMPSGQEEKAAALGVRESGEQGGVRMDRCGGQTEGKGKGGASLWGRWGDGGIGGRCPHGMNLCRSGGTRQAGDLGGGGRRVRRRFRHKASPVSKRAEGRGQRRRLSRSFIKGKSSLGITMGEQTPMGERFPAPPCWGGGSAHTGGGGFEWGPRRCIEGGGGNLRRVAGVRVGPPLRGLTCARRATWPDTRSGEIRIEVWGPERGPEGRREKGCDKTMRAEVAGK